LALPLHGAKILIIQLCHLFKRKNVKDAYRYISTKKTRKNSQVGSHLTRAQKNTMIFSTLADFEKTEKNCLSSKRKKI